MRRRAKASSAGSTECSGGRSLCLFPLALLAAGLFFSLLGAPSAAAATATPTYTAGAFFGAGGGGAQGVAFEPGTGNVASANAGGGVVLLNKTDGTGLTPIATGGEPNGIAFDPTSGDLYVADAAGNTIKRYVSDGAPDPTFTVDPTFASPPQGAGAGEVGSFASRIAVDPGNGDVLVADTANLRVSRYSDTGTFLGSFNGSDTAGGPFTALDDIAVGPGGVTYVVDGDVGAFTTRLEKFDSAGASHGALPLSGSPVSVAVDPDNGEVHVGSRGATTQIENFDAAGVATAPPIGLSACCGPIGNEFPPTAVAVNAATKGLYVQVGGFSGGISYEVGGAYVPGVDTPVISQAESTSVHAAAAVDFGPAVPIGPSVHFEFCPGGGFVCEFIYSGYGAPSIEGAPVNPWQRLPGQTVFPAGPSTVEEEISGLDADTDYLIQAVVANGSSKVTSGRASVHTPVGPPRAVTSNATDIDTDSAVIHGSVNPFGQPTTYHFEYGTTTAYGSRVPANEVAAGSGRKLLLLARTLADLAPATTYYYRIVAQGPQGTAFGDGRTFTTGAADAPNRAYEQVTPVNKDGGSIKSQFNARAAADGSALIFGTDSVLGDAALLSPRPRSAPVYPQYASYRGEADWEKPRPLDPPTNLYRGILAQTTFGVSADFRHAFVASSQKLADGATEGALNLYVTDIPAGTYAFVGSTDEPDGLTRFLTFNRGFDKFESGAPDFSWIVFYSPGPLLPEVNGPAMYRWSAAAGLQVVSVMPDGSQPPAGNGILLRNQQQVIPARAVSDDGHMAYFAITGSGELPGRGVYLRENVEQEQSQVNGTGCTKPEKACTIAISVSEIPGDPGTPHPGAVAGISRDGRYAAFMVFDETPLTPDAPALSGNLYRYDTDAPVGARLTYLGGQSLSGFSSVALKPVSNDGRIVYFIGSGDDDPPVVNTANLYAWSEGTVHTLVRGIGPAAFLLGGQASPDGRYFVLAQPDDDGVSQAFIYDTTTWERECASCTRNGSPSTGRVILQSADPVTETGNTAPRIVNDRGQVFFTTATRLVAADVNGSRDVYVYQEGQQTLISPGNAPFNANFLDASADGNDVFFSTAQGLVGQDTDRSIDAYDARVGGGLASQNRPAAQECIRDDCKATPAIGPELPFGGSEALSGPGNIETRAKKRCEKGQRSRRVKGKSRCVRRHKSKANGNGRQDR